MAESTIDIGIAFKVKDQTEKYAKNVAMDISKQIDTMYKLINGNVPHISLFQGRFFKNVIESVIEQVDNITKRYKGIDITFSKTLLFRKNGNVFWNVEHNAELLRIHQELCLHLFPLTKGLLMEQFSKRLSVGKNTNAEITNIRKYGFALADTLFLPHITICQLKSYNDHKRIRDVTITKMNTILNTIILGSLRYNGSIKDILFEYNI